ncbi:MAG: glycosyltransferase family 4 protein [Nitriliruptoraceae bacterium]
MRVVLVSPYDLSVPGGVQQHVRSLGTALRQLGDEVHIIGPARESHTAAVDGVTTIGGSRGIRFNGSVAPISWSPAGARAARRTIAALQPDIVHVHEPLVPTVGVAAVRQSAAPVVATFHAFAERARLYRFARRPARHILARLRAAIAVSRSAARFHAAALGVDPAVWQIIPNGVNVARFASDGSAGEHGDSSTAVLFVGRFEPRKGLPVLLEAVERLHRKGVRLNTTVVGDDRAHAPRRFANLPDVEFVGRVDNKQLAALYSSTDLFVSPALGGESFGIVLIEAMAAGACVIASDIPGYRDVLEDGRLGHLVPPNDPTALAEVIGRLARQPAVRAGYVRAARVAVNQYDWQVVAARIRTAYNAAIEMPSDWRWPACSRSPK